MGLFRRLYFKLLRLPEEDPRDFVATGVRIEDRYIRISEKVALRVISFIRDEGPEEPEILFVSGWVSRITGWTEVLRQLTATRTVHYLETREKISSRIQGRVSYGVPAMAQDVQGVVEGLGLQDDRYVLVGSSLGATAILESWAGLPSQPAALILIAPNAEFRVPWIWKLIIASFYPGFYALIKPSIKWYLRTFRLDLSTDDAQYLKYSGTLDAGDPWKLRHAVLEIARYRVWNKLGSITTPVLIISASRDKLHEPENLRRIAALLPGATVRDLETNSRTHSREVLPEIDKFLDHLKSNHKEQK